MQNGDFFANVGFDTAENEPSKVGKFWQNVRRENASSQGNKFLGSFCYDPSSDAREKTKSQGKIGRGFIRSRPSGASGTVAAGR